MILYNLFYLNIELRNKYILSEICPKIEKTTDYQWFLSGWQDCFSPTTPNSSLKLLRIEPRLEPAKNKKSPTTVELFLSGWQDSNLRPPHPKCGAIPGYATPRLGITFLCGTNIQHILLLSRLYFRLSTKLLIDC